MAKRYTILYGALVFFLIGTEAFSSTQFPLPTPVRPITFPLQRPSLVSDVIAWGYSVPSNKTDTVAVVSSPGWHGALELNNMGRVSYYEGLESGPDPIPVDLGDIVQVAASEDRHFLALKADGTVIAWNSPGETNIPAGLSNVVQVAAGINYSIALKSDGTVIAWNSSGETNIPTGLSNVVQVAAGEYHFLALKADGTVVAWGNNSSGKTSIPAGLSNVVQVAAGYAHSIALKSDGTVVAWGDNSYGQTNIPAGLSNVIQVAAGYDHSIALKNDGTVVAWGNNQGGQSSVPENLSDVIQVVAGDWLSIALVHKKEAMVSVQGGTLPQDSALAGTTVSSFEIGKYEVTWGQWQEVRDWAIENDYPDLAGTGAGDGANHPVRDVSWYDVVKWCNAKSEKEGLNPVYSVNGTIYRSGEFGDRASFIQANTLANGYRLPTEDERGWAALGGNKSQGYVYSGSNDLNDVGWYKENSANQTHSVGTKTANELGIHDMSGNVGEWCWDKSYLHINGVDGGPDFDAFLGVFGRGGSMIDAAADCESKSSLLFPNTYPSLKYNYIGFRLAKKGAASPDPSPTPSPTPTPTPPDFSRLAGTYIGNYRTTDLENPADTLLRNGQVLITVQKKRTFSGSVLLNGRKAGFRGKFDVNGNWSGQVTLAGHMVEIEMLLEGGELGNRVTGTLGIDGDNGEDAASFVFLPVSNSGSLGDEFELAGSQINMVLMSEGISNESFGHGYAMGKCGKDGVIRFTGRLADNAAWSGAARVVRDEVEGLRLPVAVALTTVRGLLIGEATIDSAPDEGEPHLQSSAAWRWVRSANSKSKTFAEGFVEELGVMGQVWSWTKGTSVLGSSSANFTLTLSAPSGFVMATGAESLSGSLSASNKPTWSLAPPKGFTMKITPTSGLVSGKVPRILNGKAKALSYQGLIFPSDMDLDSGATVRGAGFLNGSGASGTMEIIVP